MKIIRLELKKCFRPVRLMLVLALLCYFCFAVSESQRKALSLTDTASYPDLITTSDTLFKWRSPDLQFHDHLLEHYGKTITTADLPRLASEREQLRNQITAAAAQDPIALKYGMEFQPETGEFRGSIAKDSAGELSQEDWDYIGSYEGGTARLKGTDHPIAFLSQYQTVIDWIEAKGVYHVMSYDLIGILEDNFLIVIVFSCGALLLTVPYGVLEAKSRTEGLSASTKTGRAHYGRKLAGAALASGIMIGLGVLLAVLTFFQWKVSRYYGCDVGDAMNICFDNNTSYSRFFNTTAWSGMSYGAFYGLRLLLLFLLGLCVNLLAAILSLRIKNAVTAIACTLPMALFLLVYHLAYNMPDSGFIRTPGHPYEVVAVLFLLTTGITATAILRRRKKDLHG